jgi:hypothetical protein
MNNLTEGDRRKYAILGVVALVVIGLLAWSAQTFLGGSEAAAILSLESNPPEVPVEAVLGEKIIYTSDLSYPKEALINDCEFRGGEFDECGSSSEGSSVCAYTCEL